MTTADTPPCVLVVDDEPDLRAMLRSYLTPRGLTVLEAADPAAMRAALRTAPVDLVILDLGIGSADGLQLLAELRAGGDPRPVVVLSGRHALDDRLSGLARGADDYLTKPFEPRELLARIRAVLRRAPTAPAPRPAAPAPSTVRLGRVLLDPRAGRVTAVADGGQIPVTAMELELLRTLLRHRGTPLSRERLHEIAFGAAPVQGSRGIDNLVSRLRRRIEPDPEQPTVLVTVRGEGYALAPGDSQGVACQGR